MIGGYSDRGLDAEAGTSDVGDDMVSSAVCL